MFSLKRTPKILASLSCLSLILMIAGCSDGDSSTSSGSSSPTPNILFIVMDDVGIDQMKYAGYGDGTDLANTPVIDTLVAKGVTFSNTWSAPECSPTRAMYFNGRYPTRTSINSAIIPIDLANSSMNPDEVTTPRILRNAGYKSALIGKSHLTGYAVAGVQSNAPYGDTAMSQLGWDYFKGWVDAAPYPIDTTAGGIAAAGTYACGWVPTVAQDSANGADTGACYTVAGFCAEMSIASTATQGPGRTCLQQGGIFDPNQSCKTTMPTNIASGFASQNAHYAGTLVENFLGVENPVITTPNDPSGKGRGFRSVIESDATIEWINAQTSGAPWMATMSFAAAHAPFQPPPSSLIASIDTVNGTNCAQTPGIRTIMKQMIEAMDTEIGRVLVDTGIATRNADGSINYDPAKSNTVIVFTGDNGSYFNTVHLPFAPLHSKAYVNQSGVWVPLVIAGPMVVDPGRKVNAMINVTDLYEFFGEVAGLKVRDYVPENRAVDSYPMLSYLTNPNQTSIRDFNFTYGADNLRSSNVIENVQGACVLAGINVCTEIIPGEASCGMQGGVWYGPDSITPIHDCCGAAKFIVETTGARPPTMIPIEQYSVRNASYKLNQVTTKVYSGSSDTQIAACKNPSPIAEFYMIDEVTPIPKIDRPPGIIYLPDGTIYRLDGVPNNLDITSLSGADKVAYDSLYAELTRMINTKPTPESCPGDGNFDGKVDQSDMDGYRTWVAKTQNGSTWYDFNLDGFTNNADLEIITANLGNTCAQPR
jgi:hypothetical protein